MDSLIGRRCTLKRRTIGGWKGSGIIVATESLLPGRGDSDDLIWLRRNDNPDAGLIMCLRGEVIVHRYGNRGDL